MRSRGGLVNGAIACSSRDVIATRRSTWWECIGTGR
jgi:hypothetical protein